MRKEAKADKVREDRRGFLKLAAAGGAAAAAAGAATLPAQSAVPKRGAGYVETDHVRTYYKTCRF